MGTDVQTLVEVGFDAYGIEPGYRQAAWDNLACKDRLIAADGKDAAGIAGALETLGTPLSAELRADQRDTDSLPPYEVLDPILEAFIERDLSVREIVELGYDRETVIRILEMVRRNEYKRRQAPPGVRISTRAFGRDWRYPITSGYRVRDS